MGRVRLIGYYPPMIETVTWLQVVGGLSIIFLLGLSLSLVFLFSQRLKDLANKAELIRGELAESEARYRLLAENATDVIWTVRLPDLKFTYISPSITRLRGLSVEQAMAETFLGSVVPEQRKAIRRLIRNRIKRFERGEFTRPEAQRVEVCQQCADGREITVEIIATLIVDENNTVTGIQGISRNVTGRKQAEMGKQAREAILSALAQAARLLFSTNDKGYVMGDALAGLAQAVGADRVYVFENHTEPQTGELLASMRYEWVGPGVEPQIQNPKMQGVNYSEAIPNWHDLLERGEPVHGLVEDLPEAERLLIEAQGIRSILVVPIFFDGLFWGQIGFDDCTLGRTWSQIEIDALGIAAATIGAAIRGIQAEQELQYLVSTDSLTGLCSRRIFMEEAQAAHRQALEEGHEMGLLIMDLDYFKQVNDTYGHPVGDEALRAFARVCRQALRGDDLIGRMGGEEFAVLLRQVDLTHAREVAEKLRRRIEEERIEVQGAVLRLTVSIGLALSSRYEKDYSELLKRADKALYQAKDGGRNRVELAVPVVRKAMESVSRG